MFTYVLKRDGLIHVFKNYTTDSVAERTVWNFWCEASGYYSHVEQSGTPANCLGCIVRARARS